MGLDIMYKKTKQLLWATAATGRGGCDTMFPTTESSKWVVKQAIKCWKDVQDKSYQPESRVHIPETPDAEGLWKVLIHAPLMTRRD